MLEKRIMLALPATDWEYVQQLSKSKGSNITATIKRIIREHRATNTSMAEQTSEGQLRNPEQVAGEAISTPENFVNSFI